MKNVVRIAGLCLVMFVAAVCFGNNGQAYGASTVNKESLVTNVQNPSNAVIKYDVTVPPGETIDYSVTLTPDKKEKLRDNVTGSWKNKTKKTVKKTITVRVKCIGDKYKIKVSYQANYCGQKIIYSDEEKAVSALKSSIFASKLKWDITKFGKGEKDWLYVYKPDK